MYWSLELKNRDATTLCDAFTFLKMLFLVMSFLELVVLDTRLFVRIKDSSLPCDLEGWKQCLTFSLRN